MVDPPGSAARSRAFYRELGPDGLAIRTKPEWDAQIVQTVVALLPDHGRVLDAGCGYGRIAIPLARRGYDVTGLDISPNLLRAARGEARRSDVAVRFDQGSMTALPYADGLFDAVLSLWTAFYELLDEREQVDALAGFRRVLRPEGTGIIEGPVYAPPTADEIASGQRSGPDHRIAATIIAGRRQEMFAHDPESLRRICAQAGISDARVDVQNWAGRPRRILQFHG